MDIVTVYHNETNFLQSVELNKRLLVLEEDFTFNLIDNSIENRGFAKACNIGASRGDHEVIGFLNPDVEVDGPFFAAVEEAFSEEDVVITGSNHGKSQREVRAWGLNNWVCGCTMFVRRDWWDSVGGFDERYFWSYEDTDLCRQAERDGKKVLPIDIPIRHESPSENSPEDTLIKQRSHALAHAAFCTKWRGER